MLWKGCRRRASAVIESQRLARFRGPPTASLLWAEVIMELPLILSLFSAVALTLVIPAVKGMPR